MLEYVEIYSYFRNVRFDTYLLLSQKFNVNEFLTETLSTREQANLLWFLIVIILLLLWNKTRKSILEIIKAFSRILFTVWGGIVLCYLILIGLCRSWKHYNYQRFYYLDHFYLIPYNGNYYSRLP